MVKFVELYHTFNYHWNQVSGAYWRRYPNPYSKHVLTEDTIDRYINKDGQLVTRRLISKVFGLPKLAGRFSSTRVFIIEESIVDPINKVFSICTKNIGLKHLGTIEERVTYRISSENNKWTSCERKATINTNMLAIGRAVQMCLVETFKENCARACKGLQFVLDSMDV